ncbi:hypothetical protein RRG08_016236 [Elysia crispata]|uniref:Uncharacterized protein n=1 Tax=Elysia crispata TaxID=231223 RepID=A0AAE0ZPX4_9GAST|nr:hypothetical protein RRG08_016236 [Elysia crispata]
MPPLVSPRPSYCAGTSPGRPGQQSEQLNTAAQPSPAQPTTPGDGDALYLRPVSRPPSSHDCVIGKCPSLGLTLELTWPDVNFFEAYRLVTLDTVHDVTKVQGGGDREIEEILLQVDSGVGVCPLSPAAVMLARTQFGP